MMPKSPLGVVRSGAADDVERPGVNPVSADSAEGTERRGPGGLGMQGVTGEGHHAILTEGAQREGSERGGNALR